MASSSCRVCRACSGSPFTGHMATLTAYHKLIHVRFSVVFVLRILTDVPFLCRFQPDRSAPVLIIRDASAAAFARNQRRRRGVRLRIRLSSHNDPAASRRQKSITSMCISYNVNISSSFLMCIDDCAFSLAKSSMPTNARYRPENCLASYRVFFSNGIRSPMPWCRTWPRSLFTYTR